MGRPGDPGQTTHRPGSTPRPGSPGIRITEGHLQLTEKLLDEQRRNLLELPHGVGGQVANVPTGAAGP
jgi:hypothetical protein